MGGGGNTTFGSEKLNIDPAQQQRLDSTINGLTSGIAGFGQQAGQAAGQIKTDFSAHPSGGSPLDNFSQSLLSLTNEQAGQKLGGVQQGIAQKFGASQPGLAGILQSQAAMQSQLGQNGTPLQIAAAQRDRQMQEQSLGNAAVAQKLQLSSLPLEAQQNLMQVLAAYAGLTGTKSSFATPTPDNRTVLQQNSPWGTVYRD